MASRRQVSPRNPDGTRGRTGPHLGPVKITATRVTLAIAVLGSLGYLLYGITVRDSSQIPTLASGSAVLGIVFVALAVAGAMETVRSARADRPGRSVVMAVAGGMAAVAAFGLFAAAALLALMYR